MSLKTLIKAQIGNTWWKVKYKYLLKYNQNWYLLNIIFHKYQCNRFCRIHIPWKLTVAHSLNEQ